MKINTLLLNDEPSNTMYKVGVDDVQKIIFHEFYVVYNVFEVIFSDGRESVKVPYHSILLWR